LWHQIRENASRAGRPIVLINETEYEHTVEWLVASGLQQIPSREEFLALVDFAQRDRRTLLDPHHKIPAEPNFDYGRADKWTVQHWDEWLDRVIGAPGKEEEVEWAWSSVQLSCHDDGWEDFAGDSPYVAQGSRFAFGYGALYSGMIPIFMSGEEFNAPYQPLPKLSPHLFGGAQPGKGTWLYGGMLRWDALEKPEHRAMVEDVKKLIAIRKQEADVLAAFPNYRPKNLRRIPYQADHPCPSPYARWNENKLIVVAGNLETGTDLTLTLSVPVADLGLAGLERYRVTDLWTREHQYCSAAELEGFECAVLRDKVSGGGVRLLKIEPA
jgi:hypothetical protein